jgi:hypothetical protein
MKTDGIACGSSPMAGFGISGVEASGSSATIVIVTVSVI